MTVLPHLLLHSCHENFLENYFFHSKPGLTHESCTSSIQHSTQIKRFKNIIFLFQKHPSLSVLFKSSSTVLGWSQEKLQQFFEKLIGHFISKIISIFFTVHSHFQEWSSSQRQAYLIKNLITEFSGQCQFWRTTHHEQQKLNVTQNCIKLPREWEKKNHQRRVASVRPFSRWFYEKLKRLQKVNKALHNTDNYVDN